MPFSFQFDSDQFNRLFPFYMLIDRSLRIVACGHSIKKLCGIEAGNSFTENFSIPRPYTPIDVFGDLQALQHQLVVLENTRTDQKKLRGQLEYLPIIDGRPDTEGMLFIGSPWFGSMEQVKENRLQIDDFAFHDPLIDLLHVLKSQEITNNDLKELIATINQQKTALKKANKEIHDIALFPRQNPDPLIRINFVGEILQNNPAAALLDFFEFEGELLRNDDFFKLVANHIDKTNPRWIIEAKCGAVDYSFLCITMQDEGYINIYGRDITQKKKQDDQLKRLSLVASANKNAVLFTDPEGYITWANEAFCLLTGYSLNEAIGKTPVQLCKGALTDKPSLDKLLQSFYGGMETTTDVIFHRKDQSWFWGHVVIQPLHNEDQSIREFFGIIQDVTTEKDQQEKLKVLSQIAEDNINAVIIADKEGRITWTNKSFTTITGYLPNEVIGKKPGHLLQGPETDSKTRQYLKEQIAKGEPFNAEIISYTKANEKYWLRIQGQAIKNEQGEITGYFALEEDITKEKESQGRFRKALESIGDNVWEHDFATGITYFSQSYNQFLGYSSDDWVDNQQLWWNSVHPEDVHFLEESDRKYKTGLADSHNLEYRLRHKDGSINWVLDRGVTIERNAEGKPLRIIGTHTDITNIKRIEAELANRVRQFQSLSENIPGVIYEFEFRQDGSERLRYISPAIEKIFGLKPEAFRRYVAFVHTDDREAVREKIRHSRQTLEPFYAEARFVVPDQPVRWHSVHTAFSYNTDEGNAVFTGFLLDITERKNAEQKLEEQRQFYENILNNMPADIAVFSPNHEYLFVNPRGIKDAALRQWIIGKRDEDYFAYRNKPAALAAGRRAMFNEVLQSKRPKEWEEKNTKPDGEEEYILRRWYPVLNDQGAVSLVIGYGVDITERKQVEVALQANEEKYRGIIANMNLGLMEMNKEGKIEFANQTLLAMTHLQEHEAIGYDAMSFLSSGSKQSVEEKMKRRGQGISDAYEVQTDIDGQSGWWFVSSAPKFSATGEHVGSIVICLDITKQKQLEEELIASREQAEMLASARETFLANMSHEIRTPMNAIIGMGNQLGKTALNEQQQFYLKTIHTAADNLLVIINDILDLSKIEAGKLSLEEIPFSPAEVCKHVRLVLLHKAEEKGLTLTQSLHDSRMAPLLIGDPHRLNQVLLNLVSNAIKFTEKGGVDISCEVLEDEPSAQSIQVSVTDTGIGMDPEFLARLFDKFSQEYESVSRKYGGTGLGMSICKELVELMGGTITAESTKGQGTTVSFIIRLTKAAGQPLAENATLTIDEGFLEGKRILVADDNDMNRLVAATILENYGATILEAAHGREAVTMALEANPDLILMDIQMPEMNGYEATRALREQQCMIPIVALTANAIRGEQEKCIQAGMNDYVTKPFKEEDLLQKLSAWMPDSKPPLPPPAEPAEAPEEPLYSLQELRSFSRGNEAFVNKMLQLFIDQAPTTMEAMQQAYAQGDTDAVMKLAHRLKPSLHNLGMIAATESIRNIEKNAGTLHAEGQLQRVMDEVSNSVALVKKQLTAYLQANADTK